MEAIKIMQQYWEQLKRLAIYAQYCAENEMQDVMCRDFWTWSAIAIAGVGGLVVFFCCRKIIKEQIEFYRNKKRLEARAIVADAETIDAHRWKGDDAGAPIPEGELADEIRKAVKERQSPLIERI